MNQAILNDSDASPADDRRRPASVAPHLVTPRGLRLIDQRIESLEEEAAFASGETAAALRAELDYWVARRTVAQLVEHDPTPRQAGFGTRVTIKRGSAFEDVYIVGEDESDPINGRLAWSTPLARQLDGANRGDTFTLRTDGKTEEIIVLAIRPGDRG